MSESERYTVPLFIGHTLGVLTCVGSTAFATMVMWGWFVVPLGVVPLSYAHALGLTLMVSFATGALSRARIMADADKISGKKTSDVVAEIWAKAIAVWAVVGFAYLYHLAEAAGL